MHRIWMMKKVIQTLYQSFISAQDKCKQCWAEIRIWVELTLNGSISRNKKYPDPYLKKIESESEQEKSESGPNPNETL